jgi:hypothetical protein
VGVASRVVLGAAPALEARLRSLAARRLVFFAGLPGTGKSLLVHQLAHLAAGAGRSVHLLQWDVARPVFEASPAGQRYPLKDGVTHPVIRKAAGLWVRQAVVAWNERTREPGPMLIGETPFIGSRFVELARRKEDGAEALLRSASCRFVVPVPSPDVRRVLEAERERRSTNPLHAREREDAPPRILRQLWDELAQVARALGIGDPGPEYDPVLYRRIYEAVLRHRNVEVVPLDVILPTGGFSVYDFAADVRSLVPTEEEAGAFIATVERRNPDPAVLDREIGRWWEV